MVDSISNEGINTLVFIPHTAVSSGQRTQSDQRPKFVPSPCLSKYSNENNHIKKDRPPQEHRPRGKEYRCCCPRSRQGAWTRGASAFSRSPKVIKLLGLSTLYLGLVDDDVTLPLNETEFLVLRILSNTVMAQFNRNMMLEFSKNTEH